MLKGLIHGHQGLAYLILLSASLSLLLAIVNAAAGNRLGLVRVGVMLQRRVEPALMGIIMLLGIGAWVVGHYPITTVTFWLGFVAVGLQGMNLGMVTKPALVALAEGDADPRMRWVGGAVVNAIIIYGIFGLMQAS